LIDPSEMKSGTKRRCAQASGAGRRGGSAAGGVGRRKGVGFTEPGCLARADGFFLGSPQSLTDVVGHLGQMQFLPLRHSSFPMNPNNLGFADLTSQRHFP